MTRSCVILGLAIILAAGQALSQGNMGEGQLIPVLPRYQEAAYQGGEPFSENLGPARPSPSDQFYVFWLLGQVISYPVDKVEALIIRLKDGKKSSGNNPPYDFNPFESRALKQIPPAPPVTYSDRNAQ